jgi:hypothetical protein
VALPLHHVRAVDAGGRYLDENLARTSRRLWTFGRDQHLRTARLTDFNHQHLRPTLIIRIAVPDMSGFSAFFMLA